MKNKNFTGLDDIHRVFPTVTNGHWNDLVIYVNDEGSIQAQVSPFNYLPPEKIIVRAFREDHNHRIVITVDGLE